MKIICTLALVFVAITMLARANDLRWRPGLKWNVRLIGFMSSGVSPIGIIGYAWMGDYPTASAYLTVFLVGIAFVFATTPQLPPWWRWISGKEDANETN